VDCGGGAIACRSACEAFGQDRYCCSGAYGMPPDGVLVHFQDGVPARLQLRVRRQHQHLHLQRRRLQRRLLPPVLRVS
jgi:hypothetical protein